MESVQQRLKRVVEALGGAGVRYAVVGGHAVAAYVARIDRTAVRMTRDIDLLVERNGLAGLESALRAAGFERRDVAGTPFFLDPVERSARSGIHVVFAGEKVRPDHPTPAPGLDDLACSEEGYPIIGLKPLIRMKLNAFRDKDRVHLRDLAEVGLITEDVEAGLPPALRDRLRGLGNEE
ncbi:MAG: nucleotidyltransferase family protein [Planctomycetes bacterium]|nr:nucleotidyltransferase family protein [Planctomycetota bacterium]